MRRNIVYNSIIAPSLVTSEYTMVLYNLIGRRWRYDVITAVPLLLEKLRVNIFFIQF